MTKNQGILVVNNALPRTTTPHRTTTPLTPSRREQQRCVARCILASSSTPSAATPPCRQLVVPPPSLSKTSTLGVGISRTDLDVSRPKPTKTSYSVSFLAALPPMPSVGGRSLRSLVSRHPKGNRNTFCGPFSFASNTPSRGLLVEQLGVGGARLTPRPSENGSSPLSRQFRTLSRIT